MKTLSLFCTLLLSVSIFAVKPPVKFGKIDIADLEMTQYEYDTSAYAIVLCEYGRFIDNASIFTHTIRIKILKKEGLSWANHGFWNIPESNIKGLTYNLVDGKIVTHKLEKESVYKMHVIDNYYNVRVAMPNVKVGSVFDIQFTYTNAIPTRWYFQRTIPVVHSELHMDDWTHVSVGRHSYGYEPFVVNERNRWVTKNVPAMKEEAFTNSIENYITKFEMEISTINFPGHEEHSEKYYRVWNQYIRNYSDSWQSVARYVYHHENFGKNLEGNVFLTDVVREIRSNTSDKLQQLQLAYNAAQHIKWNKNSSMYCSMTNLLGPYNDQTGNSSDINMVLIALLRKLNIDANPVIMSSRDNGILPITPTLRKMNYAICQAVIDGKEYLVDATDELLPYSLLPEHCLNLRGYGIYAEDKITEVPIQPQGKDTQKTKVTVTITPELTMEGTISQTYSQYAAYNFRKSYSNTAGKNEFIENIENTNPGIRIKSMNIEALNEVNNDVEVTSEFTNSSAITSLGNQILIRPLLQFSINENPFKMENRLYPIDYAYQRSNTIYVQYQIPDGYQVEELPEPLRIALPEKAASVVYSVVHQNKTLTVMYKFDINKVTFLPEEYAGLKQIYTMIIEKHAEPILLKKL